MRPGRSRCADAGRAEIDAFVANRLAGAGLPPVAALHAATGAPAERFGLTDRGVLEPDRRADSVLVSGDATRDVRALRDIEVVWRNGRRIDRTPPG